MPLILIQTCFFQNNNQLSSNIIGLLIKAFEQYNAFQEQNKRKFQELKKLQKQEQTIEFIKRILVEAENQRSITYIIDHVSYQLGFHHLTSTIKIIISVRNITNQHQKYFKSSINLSTQQPITPDKIQFSAIIIKLMLEKPSQISSSAVMSSASRSVTSLERKSKKKVPYKIQICNQNLEQAIKEVKENVKDNPEWKLSLKAVVSQYPPSKQKMSFVNQSQRNDGLQNQLPPGHKLAFPGSSGKEKNIYEKLKFTQTKKKEYEEKLTQLKEKKMQIEVSSLEKQMKAKLYRKIQENLKLKEKYDMIRDIEQRREQSIRLSELRERKKRQQASLLHESSIANAKMLRRHRNKSHKKQLREARSQSQESALSLRFKEHQQTVTKIEQKQILVARYRTLRCASQNSLRRRSTDRQNLCTPSSIGRSSIHPRSLVHVL